MCRSTKISWNWYQFQQLSPQQLYQSLKLRQDVFIIEQQCIYPDIDGLDPNCLHLLGNDGENLVAYLRLIPAKFRDADNIAFGRIISSPRKRGVGIGKSMMQRAMQYAKEHYPAHDIHLGAQYHLQAFYQKFGFNGFGEPYDEDGIQHINMLYKQNAGNCDD